MTIKPRKTDRLLFTCVVRSEIQVFTKVIKKGVETVYDRSAGVADQSSMSFYERDSVSVCLLLSSLHVYYILENFIYSAIFWKEQIQF